MWLYVYWFLLTGFLYDSLGLQCWQCEQAASSEECQLTGRNVRCIGTQDICWTAVRREKKRMTMWKGCKQQTACEANEKQNYHNPSISWHQCSDEKSSSLCTCCCDTSLCNQHRTCKAEKRENIRCPDVFSQFRRGEALCSDLNNVGSVCNFFCNTVEFSIHPTPEAGISQCMPDGKWSQTEQCCARPCPPFVPIDLIALVTAQNYEVFKWHINIVVGSILRTYKMSADSMQVARIPFSGDVDTKNEIPFEQSKGWNSSRYFEEISKQKFAKTDDDLTNTGRALWYAVDIFQHRKRPKEHLNFVVLATDSNSDDEVLTPARQLRSMGVVTFVQFLRPTDSEQYNMTQLLEIAGAEERVLIINKDGTSVGNNPATVQSYVCDHICDFY